MEGIIEKKIPVLFIIMEFAPVNTTGNFRSLKFVKYLNKFGIDPIIVTFKEEQGAEYLGAKIDNSLLSNIPQDTSIYRIDCLPPQRKTKNKLLQYLRIYFNPEDTLAKRWKKNLLSSLDEIIKIHQPRILYTSLPPFSSGKLCAFIAKKFSLPLVVDMRDLWASFSVTPKNSYLHYLDEFKKEDAVFIAAKKIICVTPQLESIFISTHPKVAVEKYEYIPNGFDSDLKNIPSFEFKPQSRKIKIGYVGSFYYDPKYNWHHNNKKWWKRRFDKMLTYAPQNEDWLYRTPYFFFKTIATLLKKHPEFINKIEIEFIGTKPSWLQEMVDEFNLNQIVYFHGFVNSNESLMIQKDFDFFLATSEKVIAAEHYCLPSKIFDYVSSGKPVLGFVTSGIQREFIEKGKIGLILDPDNENISADLLFGIFKNGINIIPDTNYLSNFQRINCTEKLSKVFYKIDNDLKSELN